MGGTDEPRQQASLFGEVSPAPQARQVRKPTTPQSALDAPEATNLPPNARPLAARMRPQTLASSWLASQRHCLRV